MRRVGLFIATVMTGLTRMRLINQMNLGMIFSLIHPNPNSIHSNSYKSLSNKFVTLPNNSKVEVSAIGAYH